MELIPVTAEGIGQQVPQVGEVTTGQKLLLGLGTTAGVAAMTLVQWPFLRRLGFRFHFVWNWRDRAIRKMATLSAFTVGYVITNQLASAALGRNLAQLHSDGPPRVMQVRFAGAGSNPKQRTDLPVRVAMHIVQQQHVSVARREGRYGLETMCIGGGQGIAAVFERAA